MTRTTLAAGLAALVFCLGAGQASSAVTEDQFQIRNTGDLAALCAADPAEALGTAALNFCHGYATGAYQVMVEAQTTPRARQMFCMPKPEPTRNQSIVAFVQWARGNQARLALPPADGVAQFLSQTYPCPAPKR